MSAATIGFLISALVAAVFTWRVVLLRPSITLLLFSALLVIHVIPMLVYLNLTGPETFIYEAALRPVNAEFAKSRLLWAMALMFIFIIIGTAFSSLVAPKKWKLQQSNARNQFTSTNNFRYAYHAPAATRLVLWLVAAAMCAIILIESQPQKIYHYFASGESELGKILLRRTEGGTSFYLYNVFLYSVAPFLVMVLYCLQRQRPRDGELKLLFIFFFFLVFVGKLGTLSKAPVVIFLLQFGLLMALLSKTEFSFRILIKLLIFALLLLTIIVKLTIPDIELTAVYRFLYYRIFDIPNESLLEFFTAFPDSLKHGWEYGIFGSASRPLSDIPLPNYFAVSELTRGDATSSSNVMFVGDAWAEYEWGGVIVTSFLAGFMLRTIDLYAFRRGRSDEWASINAACAFGVFTMLSTAFSTSLITGGLLLIPFTSAFFIRRRGLARVTMKEPASTNRLS